MTHTAVCDRDCEDAHVHVYAYVYYCSYVYVCVIMSVIVSGNVVGLGHY